MNRKYRVWCKNNNEWERDTCYLAPDGTLYQRKRNGLIPCREDTHVVQFSSGLPDKNKFEIYDGDVIEYKVTDKDGELLTKRMTVYLENGKFKTQISTLFAVHLICEVVGNIFNTEV